ncbi:MAG TPA: hypothetical protein VND99_00370 [Candidatus Acidoferrales bacterium]|nr:hypothetical protein [Candidatus Acidoferrales bacterium]
MDPTKSFDHLDPKLKETYARVMGTNTSGSNNTAPNTPAPPLDSALSASPYGAAPMQQAAADPNQNQSGTTPLDMSNSIPNTNLGPNPGSGPTINTMPTETTTFSPPADTAPSANPAQAQQSSPTNATNFFSNPSPAAEPVPMPGQIPPPAVEPGPVTPYAPEEAGTNQSMAGEPMSQPLPSPATVNQAAPHETSALLKVLYIVGSVIFFAVYTLFWIKIFGLPLPFPLPF